ncbi:MAG: AlkZ family DNA glycosylase [Chloroflexi bacterium]|nr:AlkZ family DNA glycosylase [Chloroflexota bacterium]
MLRSQHHRTSLDVARRRLHNQRLVGSSFTRPEEAVGWLGAVQAQEYQGAKWALAQRIQGIGNDALDEALAAGTILRTHILRPTWHFVTPADIRWLLALTAPRVHAINAPYYRKNALDSAVFAQSNTVLIKALQGGHQLTRSELESVLRQAGILKDTDDRLRLGLLMMQAELDGIICSGAMKGKQHTYALLDERVSPTRSLARTEALAKLTRRFFTSHGPATIKDFSWWSGLTVADTRAGLEIAKRHLATDVFEGQTFWFPPDMPSAVPGGPVAHLLPAYDEYTIAYKDHSGILDPQYLAQAIAGRGIVLAIDGYISGTWFRTFTKDTALVTVRPFMPLTEAESRAVAAAAQQFGKFLDMPVALA